MDSRIDIGRMDTLVTIRRCDIVSTTEGSKKYVFSDHSRVFALVDRTVNELVSNTNLEGGQYVNLTIYKIEGLTTRWQVIVEGRTYEITGIDPVSRESDFCVLTCHSIN